MFAGDAAHQMSPFGARGGNSGVQDADNLAWKLDLVLRGVAPEALLDSYHQERAQAADENLLHTTRSTDFIAPKSGISRVFRDSALALAETEPFARRLINSGRLSTATCYDQSALNGPDGFAPGEASAVRPGAAALDAPLEDGGWFLERIGDGFAGVWFSRDGTVPPEFSEAFAALAARGLPINQMVVVSRETVVRPLWRRGPAGLLPVPPRPARGGALAQLLGRGNARRARAGHGKPMSSGQPSNHETEGATVGLKRDSGMPDADGMYAAIIAAHSGLSPEDSVALNARLVLLLANHIGDAEVLQEAIAAARASLGAGNQRRTDENE